MEKLGRVTVDLDGTVWDVAPNVEWKSRKSWERMEAIKAVPEAVEGVKYLSQFFEVRFVTARIQEMEDITIRQAVAVGLGVEVVRGGINFMERAYWSYAVALRHKAKWIKYFNPWFHVGDDEVDRRAALDARVQFLDRDILRDMDRLKNRVADVKVVKERRGEWE